MAIPTRINPPARAPRESPTQAPVPALSQGGASATADRQQQTIGNQAVLRAGESRAAAAAAKPAAGDATTRDANAAPASQKPSVPPTPELPPALAQEPPPASPPPAAASALPGIELEPVAPPDIRSVPATAGVADVQREVSRAASALPGVDAGGYTAAQAAIRAQGFRLASARHGTGTGAARPARGGGGGAPRTTGDRPFEKDPVPAQTKALAAIGEKKLPELPRIGFTPSPSGRIPVLGNKPLSSTDFAVLKTTMKGELSGELAKLDAKRAEDRAAREKAFNDAEAAKTDRKPGEPAAKFKDDGPATYADLRKLLTDPPAPAEVESETAKAAKGKAADDVLPPYHEPEPPPPIVFPPAQKADIARTLAALREDRGTARGILDAIRDMVQSQGLIGPVLTKMIPQIADPFLGEVQTALDAKIVELQKGASISDEELQKAVEARKLELQRLRDAMRAGATQESLDAERKIAAEAKPELDAMAAKKALAEERSKTVKAAAPKVKLAMDAESRRARLLDYVTKDVSDLVVRFRQKGEIRASVSTRLHADVADAYRFTAQQDTYAILDRSTESAATRAGLTPASAAVGKELHDVQDWLDKRLAEVEAMRVAQKSADDAVVKGLQDEARALGDAKRDALHAWADKHGARKRSAEERLAEQATARAAQQQSDAAAIEQLGRSRLAAGVANDFSLVQSIAAEHQKGADRETIIRTLRLNAAQQAILDGYLTPGVPGDDRALSAVMAGTRTRVQHALQGGIAPKIEARILADFSTEGKALDRIGGAQRSGFEAAQIATKLHKELDAYSTEEDVIYDGLANLTKIQIQAVRLAYAAGFGGASLDADLVGGTIKGLSGNELRRAQKLMEGDQETADAIGYRVALKGNEGTWYNTINFVQSGSIDEVNKINHGKSLEERQAAENAYNAMYDPALAARLRDVPQAVGTESDPAKKAELIEKHQKSVFADYRAGNQSQLITDANASLSNPRARERMKLSVEGRDDEADAVELRGYLPTPATVRQFEEDMARQGHAGMGNLMRADRKKVEAVYERIEKEVTARGTRMGWTDFEIRAEIARRSANVERAFNSRYGAEYESHADEALRAAFATGFRQNADEVNLANALADGDTFRADAAKMKAEHRGVWADDDVQNAILAKQYADALEAERRDQLPVRRLLMAQQLADLEQEAIRRGERFTGPQKYEAQQRLQREMDRTIEKAARGRAAGNMNALREAYHDDYGGDLDAVVLDSTSGYDHAKAATLLQQNGHLTLGQTMFYAVRGNGTDEEALNALKGHTSAEIDEARKEFRSLALADRYSARHLLNLAWTDTPHDDLDMDAEILDDISGRTGFDVGQLLKGEPQTLREKEERLMEAVEWEKKAGPLGGLLASDQQTAMDANLARLRETIAMLEDPDLPPDRRDLYLTWFAQDVSTVEAGITAHRDELDSWTDRITTVVGFVVGIAVTVLTFGAAGVVLAAVLGSIAATAATMAIKAAVLGAAYGWEDIYTDIAVGVVDALTAALTAGMGEKLLGVAKAAAVPSPSRFAIGRLVQRSLGAGGRAAFLNPAESALSRAIPRSALLEGMVKRGGVSKLLAVGLAEGAENLIANIPSALTTAALDDNNYKEGNALLNVLSGTAKQAGMSAGMGLAMKPVMKAAGGVLHTVGAVSDAAFKGRAAPEFDSFDAMRVQYPEMTVKEYASLRAIHESQVAIEAQAVRDARATAGDTRQPAPDTADVRGQADADVRSTDARALPDDVAGREAADALTSRAMTKSEVSALLPASLRETLGVEVDPTLGADALHVVRVKRLGVVVDVKLVVGPSVRPLDVLRHVGTVHAMQRYIGVTGTLVRAAEYARSWVVKNGPPPFGTKAWEAWHELHKLPRMLEDRLELLRMGMLDPSAKAAIFADVDRLARQVDEHRTTLANNDLSAGRGYVAAASDTKFPAAPPPVAARPIDAAQRGDGAHQRYVAEHSVLRSAYPDARFLQVGETWIEIKDGVKRSYRVLEVRDKVTGDVILLREEIRALDAKGKLEDNRWIQRGSESNRTGVIGEDAFRMKFEAEAAAGSRRGELLLPSAVQRAGGQGFDGVLVRFDASGKATLVLIEVKNYPGRQVPLDDITAVGENVWRNLDALRKQLNSADGRDALGLNGQQARAVIAAIDARRIELEVQITEGTRLAGMDNARAGVLPALQKRAAKLLGMKKAELPVRLATIDKVTVDAARSRLEVLERLDAHEEVKGIRSALDGGTSAEGSRLARAAVTARNGLENLVDPPLSVQSPPRTLVDKSKKEFVVMSPERGASVKGVSADVERALRASAAGTQPRAQVIVDVTHLSAGGRNALQAQLAALAKKRPALDLGLVIVVDVSRQSAQRLTALAPKS